MVAGYGASAPYSQDPAYRPTRRIPRSLTWGFTVEVCPKCPCGFPPLFHHVETFAFPQVSASQGPNDIPYLAVRPRFTTFRVFCEWMIEVLFGSDGCGVAVLSGCALSIERVRFGPMRF